MKFRFRIIGTIGVLILITSIGFNIVLATSDSSTPGSDQDPLISKSYVDSLMQSYATKIQQLQEKYDESKKEIAQLTEKVELNDKTIKQLQSQIKEASTVKATPKPQTTKSPAKATPKPQNTPSPSKATPKPQTPNKADSGTTKTDSNTTKVKKGVINASILNIRQKANITSDVAGKLVKGETIQIVSKSNEWYKIKTSKGIEGWVHSKYVTEK